jgi:ribosome-associated protein
MQIEDKEKISRTKKKKAALALQRLGEQLVQLSPAQLSELELPDDLLEAVQAAKIIKKHEARRRQMQYIGSLMRQCDSAAIETSLQDLSRQSDAEVRRFKKIERWRDELVNGDDARLQLILDQFPGAEATALTDLVQNARKLSGRDGGQRNGRKLFRYLRKISEVMAGEE